MEIEIDAAARLVVRPRDLDPVRGPLAEQHRIHMARPFALGAEHFLRADLGRAERGDEFRVGEIAGEVRAAGKRVRGDAGAQRRHVCRVRVGRKGRSGENNREGGNRESTHRFLEFPAR